MVRKQKEIVKKIKVETRRLERGNVQTRIDILFESGNKYATSTLGFSQDLEKLTVGDAVMITEGKHSVLAVRKI